MNDTALVELYKIDNWMGLGIFNFFFLHFIVPFRDSFSGHDLRVGRNCSSKLCYCIIFNSFFKKFEIKGWNFEMNVPQMTQISGREAL